VKQWEIMFKTAHSWARVSKSTYSHVFLQWKRLIVRSRQSKTMGNLNSNTSSYMS